MKITASIRARMASERLPGKVLKRIDGEPMLLLQVERVRRSRHVTEVVVATTTNSEDNAIVAACELAGVDYYRGSETDVLGRVAGLVAVRQSDVHVDFCGDSPLIDPEVIDTVIGYYLDHQAELDYVTNAQKTTYPAGQEVCVARAEALLKVNATVPASDLLREHVSVHFLAEPGKYRCRNLSAPAQHHAPNIYLEVDTEKDFKVVSAIFEHFRRAGKPNFTLSEILAYLEKHPELSRHNADVERRWRQFRDDNGL